MAVDTSIQKPVPPATLSTKQEAVVGIKETPTLGGIQGETDPVSAHEVVTPAIDSNTVLHRSLRPDDLPQRIVRAEGLYLYLENGHKFLDATGGAAVACLGHNHPVINQAIADQLSKVAYTGTIFYSTSAAEELCSLLIKSTNGVMSRAYICNSGSEANEAAMKMARQYFVEVEGPDTKRCRFISRQQSYHGTTLAALGLGGHVLRRKIYEPLLSDKISRVSPCFAYRGKLEGETDEEYVARLAEELDAEFQRVGPETVCAFVAEPVVGAALGSVPAVPGYFAAMRKVCDKYGALLVADEVMSGMGRTGYVHAWQSPLINTEPDLQLIGKGLGAGYQPVAALLVNRRVVDAISKGSAAFAHGHTYQAHPVGCAAAAAVQKIVPSLMPHVRDMGALLAASLHKRLDDKWYIGNIRGMGLFWSIEFVKDKTTKMPFEPKLQVAMGIHKLAMKEPHMISLYPGTGSVEGLSGDFVILAPPYTSTKEDIELIAEKTDQVIEAFFANTRGLL